MEIRVQNEDVNTIMRERAGYRYDDMYNSGVIDFAEVLDFETTQFGNDDIYESVTALYGIELKNGTSPADIPEARENNEAILDFFKKELGTDILYCKWLCVSKEDVTNAYEVSQENVARWVIPGKMMIASYILGADGLLVISDEPIVEEV